MEAGNLEGCAGAARVGDADPFRPRHYKIVRHKLGQQGVVGDLPTTRDALVREAELEQLLISALGSGQGPARRMQ